MTIYDPKVEEAQIWMDLQEALPAMPLETIKKQVTIVHSALEACKQKEAIVIATEWKEFKEIDWQVVYDQMTKPAFVFDGRLILDAEKLRKIGFTVRLVNVYAQGVPCTEHVYRSRLSAGVASRAPVFHACFPLSFFYGQQKIIVLLAMSRVIPTFT